MRRDRFYRSAFACKNLTGHCWFQEEYYSNPGLVLDPEFQKGDSVYCFLSENEINEANARVRSDMEDGSVHQQMDQASQRAKKIGESVIISARKPGN